MRFLRRQKEGADYDKVAQRMAENIIGRQRQVADYLNKKAGMFSGKTLLVVLILFSVIFGAYCLYLITGAFQEHKSIQLFK